MNTMRACVHLEHVIIATAKVLEAEKASGTIMERKAMMKAVMQVSRGQVNPAVVKRIIDEIYAERGL
jgi:hypothetical protein